jgi:hypothetical protein
LTSTTLPTFFSEVLRSAIGLLKRRLHERKPVRAHAAAGQRAESTEGGRLADAVR